MTSRSHTSDTPASSEYQSTSHVWTYLGSGIFDGKTNMETDRKIFDEIRLGIIKQPVIRLYRWSQPTISLGINQAPASVVNLSEANRLHYPVVSRPTGGRALLHKGDICYAIVSSREFHPEFRTLTSTYKAIGRALSQALEILGVGDVETPSDSASVRQIGHPCFASHSPFEVSVRGKKICGSAQFRSGGHFLQHGSLRVRDSWDHDDQVSIWPSGTELAPSKITCIDRELGRRINFEEVEEGVLAAFSKCFKVDLRPADL